MEKKKVYLLLGLILLLALFLRIYHLNEKSLWMDEAFSVHHAGLEDIKSVSYNVGITEAAPMGYYILLHYWMKLFGDGVFALRMLSVLFSFFSIGLLYLLVRLFFDVRVGLLASFLMAISMEQILFSQEVRMYSLFTFLTLLTVYIFFQGVLSLKDGKKNGKHFFLYVSQGILLLAFYVNYLTFFLMGGLSFFLWWYLKVNRVQNRRKIILGWLIGSVILLLLAIPVLEIAQAQFENLNVNLSNTLEGKGLPYFFAQFGLFFFALPIFLLVFLIFFLFIFRKRLWGVFFEKKYDWLFFFGLIGFGLVYLYLCFFPLRLFSIPLFRVPITNSYFLIRHSLFLAPLLYVYAAYRIVFLRSFLRKISIIFLVLVSLVALAVYFETQTKTEWEEATRIVYENSEGKPLVLLDRAGISNEFLWKYYYPGDFDFVRLTWGEGKRRVAKLSEDDLNDVLDGKDDFWVVFSKNEKTAAFYKNYFDTHYSLDMEKDFYQVKVYHYTLNGSISFG